MLLISPSNNWFLKFYSLFSGKNHPHGKFNLIVGWWYILKIKYLPEHEHDDNSWIEDDEKGKKIFLPLHRVCELEWEQKISSWKLTSLWYRIAFAWIENFKLNIIIFLSLLSSTTFCCFLFRTTHNFHLKLNHWWNYIEHNNKQQ